MYSVKRLMLCVAAVLLAGCGGMGDMNPSGNDNRPVVTPGTTGAQVGQNAPNFTIKDVTGANRTLFTELAGSGGAVLYFTMWCPVCSAHMDHMMFNIMPGYPTVKFFAIDYVSGSVAGAAAAEQSAGYAGTGFITLADDATATNLYNGTMGITIVVDRFGVVRMNEDYKTGGALASVLASLP